MTESELEQRRQEFRDQEVMNKISNYSNVTEYRQQVLRSNYTRKIVDKNIGTAGKVIVWSQAAFLAFFCLLFVFSYIPYTKFIVAKIMP